ncbi:isoprenylcysteine carboxylmethyltransferase family protein [Candidatus Micrarchaeota archaeon]|nr:isoprenylcysteine carboxylmethyltransferase family protein [Candidatus Micrarchaeota archaeon]
MRTRKPGVLGQKKNRTFSKRGRTMEKKGASFWKAVAKRGAQVLFSLVLMMALFFFFAGRLDLPLAWLYFGLYFVSLAINMMVFLKYNPEVVEARSEIIKGEMKWWDKLYVVLYMLFMFAIPVVCGIDAHSQASAPGTWYYPAGVLLFVAGWSFTSWALVENKFFEGSVRIQKERGHTVVSTGPYAIIRHPGYAGMIVFYASMPLGLGSLYGLVPALLLAGAFVFRTHFEDEMLQKELKGYKEYAKKTRYRLIPFVW